MEFAQQDPRWDNRIDKINNKQMVLAWVLNYARRIDYCEKALKEKRMIFLPELCCICTMHMENRVSEKLFEIAATQALKSSSDTEKKQKIEHMNTFVNAALNSIKTEEYKGGWSVFELLVAYYIL